MKNIVKKSLFLVLGCLMASTVWGTPIANLNFEITSSTTDLPANYVYSATNKPSIKTQNGIKCIIVSDGGGSAAPTFNGTAEPSGGKRWIAFCPDVDCSVSIGIMSNKKKFFIQNASGEFFSYTNTANTVEEQTVSGLKAGQWYAMCGGSSQVYITKMAFTADNTSGGGDNPTPGGGDDPTPGGGDDPTPGGGDDPTPSTGETYAYWRFSGTDAPAIGSSESGTKMTVEFLNDKEGDTKTFGVESAAYNAAVTDENMKSQGTKGIKFGGNALYLKVTIDGGFKANDKVYVCGYNPWKISSTTEHTGDVAASIATGTSKTDYNVGSCTLTADYSALYLMRAEGSGTCICAIKVERAEGSTPVDPDPVQVEDVTFDKTQLSLEQGQTATLTATVTPSNAEYEISWSSYDPTIATVTFDGLVGTVTALKPGTTYIMMSATQGSISHTATCDVTVTSPAVQIPVTGIQLNKAETSLYVGNSETLTVTYLPADANTGKGVNWLSLNENIATVENGVITAKAVGSTVITATTTDGQFTASCNVTVEEKPVVHVTGVTLSSSTATINEGETMTLTATVSPSDAADKSVTWSSNKPEVAAVNKGVVTGVSQGTAVITVTTNDGGFSKSCTVTVKAGVPVPQTGLTLHQPEVYAASASEGGYGGSLSVVNGREYEAYYMTRDANSKFCIATTNADKTTGITTLTSGDYSCTANDGWFTFAGVGWSSASDAMGDEFGTMARRLDMDNSCEFSMHIKGFDQFAIVGKDKKIDDTSGQTKPENNRYLEVYIDDVLQPKQFNTNPTVRRYEVSSQEHVIRIVHIGSEKSSMYAFSLRVAQEPRVKYLDGNDTTQVVWASRPMKPITYYTKYNKMGETRLVWDNQEATGITLTKKGEGAIGDTLQIAGTALCPAGEYYFHVQSLTSAGVITASVPGKLTVKTQISFMNPVDTLMEVYQGEEMDPIIFSYFANSPDEITIDWGGNAPSGITGSGDNGRYTLSGTPQSIGTYSYTVSVAGGNSVHGQLTVLELNLGDNPVLYLQSDREAYKQDGVYAYIKNELGYSPVARVAQDGLRKAEQYDMYKWILISEDADAENGEVLEIISKGAGKPVLNMKSFAYAPNRLDWGEPNNGSVSDNGRYITVTRDDHPIFQTMHKTKGQSIMVLNEINRVGLMPANIHLNGSLCLATALTRDLEDYYKDGEAATFLHEIPANSDLRDGTKYICMPISISSSKKLSTDGKKLIKSVIDYLLSSDPSVAAPTLAITSFKIGKLAGRIDEEDNIIFDINRSEYPDLDLSAVTPTITLADPDNTFVIPGPDEPVDLQWTQWIPVNYTVTDHVCQRVYTVIVNFYSPEGIEDVYSAGEWVNIFDIYGRKIATTNEDIYSMPLPHGMYIVVTENGQTLKIMR